MLSNGGCGEEHVPLSAGLASLSAVVHSSLCILCKYLGGILLGCVPGGSVSDAEQSLSLVRVLCGYLLPKITSIISFPSRKVDCISTGISCFEGTSSNR